MLRTLKSALAALVITAAPAAAELELSFYTGWQENNSSTVSGFVPSVGNVSANVNWRGDSFDNPYYYGGRAIWWTQANWGFGIEGTHAKAYAPAAARAALGLSRFELSDGHNIITANLMKRWPGAISQRLTPYVGGGIGIALPHVDIQVAGAPVGTRTYDFERTGVALRGLAGLKYNVTDNWAVFGEYQFTWSDNDITIDPVVIAGPTGTLNAEIVTHALNVGISYSF